MQSVEFNQLDKLEQDIDKMLKEFPNARKELHEAFADVLYDTLQSEINQSVKDSSGKIKKFQGKYVGSKGGYAAVRAIDTSTGANSPGAITNYLENGHSIRRSAGKNPKYKPRIKKVYVDGRHFYQRTSVKSESQLIAIAEKFADRLVEQLGG